MKCEDCTFAGPISIRYLLGKRDIKGPLDVPESGMITYYKTAWCWCVHPDNGDVDNFHRMKMRFIERVACDSVNVFFIQRRPANG